MVKRLLGLSLQLGANAHQAGAELLLGEHRFAGSGFAHAVSEHGFAGGQKRSFGTFVLREHAFEGFVEHGLKFVRVAVDFAALPEESLGAEPLLLLAFELGCFSDQGADEDLHLRAREFEALQESFHGRAGYSPEDEGVR